MYAHSFSLLTFHITNVSYNHGRPLGGQVIHHRQYGILCGLLQRAYGVPSVSKIRKIYAHLQNLRALLQKVCTFIIKCIRADGLG